MNKFDVVEKIPCSRLLKALLIKTDSPLEALKNLGLIKGDWQAASFNWGRNAFYALFKQLPFKTIHFPAFTCPVLTQAAQKAGKKVKLLEIDIKTFNLDFKKLPKDELECLVAVHTFGNPLDITRLRGKYPQAYIIEDCAHALFAKFKGRYVGQVGDVVLFSLYKQVANLNGAVLLTKELVRLEQKEEALTAFFPRLLFKTKGWHHLLINHLRRGYIDTLEEREFKATLSPSFLVDRLFILGLNGLKKEIEKRREIACWYSELIENSPYLLGQVATEGATPSYYQFVVYLKPRIQKIRDQAVRNLRRKGIFLDRLWYSAPITDKKYIKYRKRCPKALQLVRSVISLPTNPCLAKEEVELLVNKLHQEIKRLL